MSVKCKQYSMCFCPLGSWVEKSNSRNTVQSSYPLFPFHNCTTKFICLSLQHHHGHSTTNEGECPDWCRNSTHACPLSCLAVLQTPTHTGYCWFPCWKQNVQIGVPLRVSLHHQQTAIPPLYVLSLQQIKHISERPSENGERVDTKKACKQ